MKNTLPSTEKVHKNTRYLLLDSKKAVFMRLPWTGLGDWGKRKCENFIVMSNMNEGRKYIKVGYV